MDTQFDRTNTVVIEGTTETLKAHVENILAGGGRIVSVQIEAPAAPGKSPSTFKIVYADGA